MWYVKKGKDERGGCKLMNKMVQRGDMDVCAAVWQAGVNSLID